MSFVFALLLVVVLICIYLYLTRNYNYWKVQNVPHEVNPIPGFGHMLPLFFVQENFGSLIEKLYKKMGRTSMYGCYVMEKPAILIRDPTLIKIVLQTHFSSFQNNLLSVNDGLDPIASKYVFLANDNVWKKSRFLLNSNFSGRKLRFIFDNTIHASEKLHKFMEKKMTTTFELNDLMSRVVSEIIATTTFGIDSQSFDDSPDNYSFYKFSHRFFNSTPIQGVRLIVRFFLPNLANLLGIRFMSKESDAYLRKLTLNFIKSVVLSSKSNTDFLQFSIKDVGQLNDNMLIAQATSIFFDGYETLVTVMTYTIYRLIENPAIQEKARKELNVVMEKFNNQLTYDALQELTYFNHIIQETLRMNPTFGDVAKVCNKEITLRGYDDLTCHLEPGDVVLIAPGSLHMDEEFWSNPTKFDPDRFSPENKNNIRKFTYLGFLEGPRICPGKRVGIMVVKTLLAMMLLRYTFKMSREWKNLPLKKNPSTFVSMVKEELLVEFLPLQTNN